MMRAILGPTIVLLLGLATAAPTGAQTSFTILHTNDFQGQLELNGSNPGAARVAAVINGVRTAVGADNVLLVDAGDVMQSSLLSNLQKGLPAIDYYRTIGYDAVTLGNHEFDWGQTVLSQRAAQAGAASGADGQAFPFLAANVVAGSCDPGNWALPAFAKPYEIVPVASGAVRVGFIGVTTTETPAFVPAEATAGLCFKDPAEAIAHYYDEVIAQADVIVVLSHLGYTDGGYGYGLPVYGDQTLAQKLINAGKPVPLIIGGHSHTPLTEARVITVTGKPGRTLVTQAYYGGRRVGRADLTVGGGEATVSWQSLTVSNAGAEDPVVKALVTGYVMDPAYQALIYQPIFYAQVDLQRNYNGEGMMGSLVVDGVYGQLNSDSSTANDVDVFLLHAGNLRSDWCYESGAWSALAANCEPGIWPAPPMLLTWGQMYSVLPFGNSVVVGNLSGAKILEVLNQSATLLKGALQPAGLRYKFTSEPTPYAFDVCVKNRTNGECEPLNPAATYRVGTVDFLFGGGDNFMGFRAMTNVTFWGDILDLFDAWAAANHGGSNPYLGPNGDGTLDGRIVLSEAGDTVPPVVTVSSPTATTYTRSTPIVIRFTATDLGTGVQELEATLDGAAVTNGFALDMVTLARGSHTLRVSATDGVGNSATVTVTFVLGVTADSLSSTAQQLYSLGQIDSKGVLTSLLAKLKAVNALILSGDIASAKAALQSFIAAVSAQSGKHISSSAAALLVGDANWLMAQL